MSAAHSHRYVPDTCLLFFRSESRQENTQLFFHNKSPTTCNSVVGLHVITKQVVPTAETETLWTFTGRRKKSEVGKLFLKIKRCTKEPKYCTCTSADLKVCGSVVLNITGHDTYPIRVCTCVHVWTHVHTWTHVCGRVRTGSALSAQSRPALYKNRSIVSFFICTQSAVR